MIQVGGATLHHGDCREVLAGLPPGTFDCIIADPPYGETSLDWDKHVDGWLPACRRALKRSGSLWCFGSARFFLERAADFRDWRIAQDVVWQKQQGSGFAADRFKRVHESAYQFYPAVVPWGEVYKDPQRDPELPKIGKSAWRRDKVRHTGKIGDIWWDETRDRMMHSVIFAKNCHGYAIHETQKPVGIITPLLSYSCPPGGLVLEPFGGACSVAVAARASGRRCVSIELRAACFEKAVNRLRNDAPLLEAAA